jgi:hypothetical protein
MELLGFSWQFWLIYCLANWIPGWLFVYKKRNWVRPKEADQPIYKPFHCLDDPYQCYSYWTVPFLFLFYIPRFLLGWCFLFIGPVVAILLQIGNKDPDAQLTPFKRMILIKACRLGIFLMNLFGAHCIVRMQRVKADYSKWLGPDYHYTYEGEGMQV